MRRAVKGVHDDIGRNALLLHAKRDLYMVAFQGVVDLLKRSEPDTGAILEAIKDIFKDLCDDWRELVDQSRRDVADVDAEARETRDRLRPFGARGGERQTPAWPPTRRALAVAEDARRRADEARERERIARTRRTVGDEPSEEDESSHSDASRPALSRSLRRRSRRGRGAEKLRSRPGVTRSNAKSNAKSNARGGGPRASATSSAPARDPFAENAADARGALDTTGAPPPPRARSRKSRRRASVRPREGRRARVRAWTRRRHREAETRRRRRASMDGETIGEVIGEIVGGGRVRCEAGETSSSSRDDARAPLLASQP